MWNGDPQPNEIVTWDGACIDGRASGHGVQRWEFDSNAQRVVSRYEGDMQDGKLHGRGVFRRQFRTVEFD